MSPSVIDFYHIIWVVFDTGDDPGIVVAIAVGSEGLSRHQGWRHWCIIIIIIFFFWNKKASIVQRICIVCQFILIRIPIVIIIGIGIIANAVAIGVRILGLIQREGILVIRSTIVVIIGIGIVANAVA